MKLRFPILALLLAASFFTACRVPPPPFSCTATSLEPAPASLKSKKNLVLQLLRSANLQSGSDARMTRINIPTPYPTIPSVDPIACGNNCLASQQSADEEGDSDYQLYCNPDDFHDTQCHAAINNLFDLGACQASCYCETDGDPNPPQAPPAPQA